MLTHQVSSFADLWKILTRFRNNRRWMFRGQGRSDWGLVPKIGREMFSRDIRDCAFFNKWKERAAGLVSAPVGDDWDWLAIAQHHGFPTRLLDWSYNPLAAAFFASAQEQPGSAALYALEFQKLIEPSYGEPFDTRWKGVRVHRPRGIVTRLVRQSGLFTIHQPPYLALEDFLAGEDPAGDSFRLEKIIIEEGYRNDLRTDLQFMGIDLASLMGDLDALSVQMGWEMERLKTWGSPYLDVDLGLVPALQGHLNMFTPLTPANDQIELFGNGPAEAL